VVVTELVLADGSVTEFLQSVHGAEAGVPVLVLTAIRNRDFHDLALELGAAEVLTKDVPVEQIVSSVKKLGGD
jgi:DNA-binding NarL/FixJ family response regulator